MKALIFVLLAAVTAEAQSVADVARKERERRAPLQTVRVITTTDAKSNSAPAPAAAPASPEQAAKPSDAKAVKPAPKSAADLFQEWTAQVDKVRVAIRELQSQETALQLQVNDLTTQVYTPVTTLQARSQAQSSLSETQAGLVTVRKELAELRLRLQQMEAQGPPKG